MPRGVIATVTCQTCTNGHFFSMGLKRSRACSFVHQKRKMNCGFVTTHRDAKYLRYQASKKTAFAGMARARTLLHHSNQFVPNAYVDSPILQHMETACRNNVSGICVVYCEPGMGKSAAAHLILKNCAAGIMIGVPNDKTKRYWDAVAKKLEIPLDDEGAYGSNWSRDLVDAVAETQVQPLNSFDRIRSVILCNPSFLADDPPDFPAERQVAYVTPRRVIVFDNFDRMNDEETQFVRSFHEQAFGLNILVFILTQDEGTANFLLRINGWQRIRPLDGIYAPNHVEGAALPACGHFPDPTWKRLVWTARQLEDLVRIHFAILQNTLLEDGRTALADVLQHLDLQDGEVPLNVIVRARRYVGGNRWAM